MKHIPCAPVFALLLGLSSTGFAKEKSCLTTNELNNELKSAVLKVDFKNVVDLGPTFTADPCPTTEPACQHGRKTLGRKQFPQIDLAVIAFQPGCKNPVVGGNVFFSRDYPRGVGASFDPKTQAVSNVKMYPWLQERFDEGQVISQAPWFKPSPGAWKSRYPANELLNPEAVRSPISFMSPYPASVFKILVALRVLQKLEEQGSLEQQLNNKYTYDFGTADASDDVTLTFAQFLDAMIQWSGNKATAALIQYLHRSGDIIEAEQKDSAGYPAAAPRQNKLNELFASLGLPALQMNRTRMQDGLWGNRDTMYLKDSSSVSHIFMPSWDTARLLWLLRTNSSTPENQKPDWQLSSKSNKKVDASSISETVRNAFWANMKNQLFHEVLSNTLHCQQKLGGGFGIPALLPQKWVSTGQLKLPVGDYPFVFAADELKGDYNFTKNLGECQTTAEVEFASKTGLTSVSGSHAGLVKGLSERGFKREYIVVLNSSLGSRFTDSNRLDAERVIPCFDRTLCYSSRINQLGANIDASMRRWLESDEYGTSTARNYGKTKGK
ncbi:MAG: serine hydrolase [Betaproteobacteria bacterium]|nr:serine hydrolase [Betaproteobacteria bacterium]